jgi:hypothetical protein
VAELLAIARAGGRFERAAEQGIPAPAARAIVERLGGIGLDRDDLLPWLDRWIDDARRELGRRSNEGEAFEAAYHEAVRRWRLGHLETASAAFMEELARDERRETERQADRKRYRLRLLEEAIRFDELNLNGEAAAQKLCHMAAIEGVSSADALGAWLLWKVDEFHERGDRQRQNAALLVAIATYRAALEEWTRERAPHYWAGTQENLERALQDLARRS